MVDNDKDYDALKFVDPFSEITLFLPFKGLLKHKTTIFECFSIENLLHYYRNVISRTLFNQLVTQCLVNMTSYLKLTSCCQLLATLRKIPTPFKRYLCRVSCYLQQKHSFLLLFIFITKFYHFYLFRKLQKENVLKTSKKPKCQSGSYIQACRQFIFHFSLSVCDSKTDFSFISNIYECVFIFLSTFLG